MRAIIMWMRSCSVHTVAANKGLLSCEWERSDCALQTAERRSEAGAACLHSGFFRAASAATWDPLLPHLPSALRTAMEGGREKPGWCLVLQVRRWGIWTLSRHELITWVPKVHRWSEGRRTTFKKCHTHLNAAEEQPWGLPSNERT